MAAISFGSSVWLGARAEPLPSKLPLLLSRGKNRRLLVLSARPVPAR